MFPALQPSLADLRRQAMLDQAARRGRADAAVRGAARDHRPMRSTARARPAARPLARAAVAVLVALVLVLAVAAALLVVAGDGLVVAGIAARTGRPV